MEPDDQLERLASELASAIQQREQVERVIRDLKTQLLSLGGNAGARSGKPVDLTPAKNPTRKKVATTRGIARGVGIRGEVVLRIISTLVGWASSKQIADNWPDKRLSPRKIMTQVYGALRHLIKFGYVEKNDNGEWRITDSGRAVLNG